MGCTRQGKLDPGKIYTDARTKLQNGELNKALAEADRGFRNFGPDTTEWSWRFRTLKAEILARQGHSEESLSLLQADPPIAFASGDIAVRRAMVQGQASSFLQRFTDAERYLAKAEEIASASRRDLLGEIWLRRGTLQFLRNNLPQAKAAFSRTFQIGIQNKDKFLEAAALGSLALVSTRQEHYDEAIDYNLSALRDFQALGDRSSIARVLGNLGWGYIEMGDYERALEVLKEAEKESDRLGSTRDQLVWLKSIGTVYLNQDTLELAEDNFKGALELAKKLGSNAEITQCFNNLSFVALRRGQFDQAEDYNHGALKLERENHDRYGELYSLLLDGRVAYGRKDFGSAKRMFHQVIEDASADTSLKLQAKLTLANVNAEEGFSEIAEEEFRSSVAIVEQARLSLKREEFRLSFVSAEKGLYDDFTGFLIRHNRTQDALQVAELSRARALLDGLGLSSAKFTFPLKGFQPEAAARRLGAVILSYWIGTTHSYLWAITSKGTQLFELPPEKDISSLVQSYRQALAGPRDPLETNNAAGERLYDILVGPAKHLIAKDQRVVIIPDGPLYSLNFETLIAPSPQPHYWIDDVTVTNASSLVLLSASSTNTATKAVLGQGNLLLIGDPISPGADYPSLPQAAPEIERIKLHFDAPRRTIASEAQATPAAYLTGDPANFSYIHLVAHGTASRTSPLDSAIILTRQNDSFKLYARDIIQHPIHAELVTISSCFGAGSRTYSGEGLVGLSWAFLRAGAHNVIGALWEVSDTSTPQLMDRLYDELTRGAGPATALRKAKLGLLHSGTVYKKPFYWAPFQLYAGS